MEDGAFKMLVSCDEAKGIFGQVISHITGINVDNIVKSQFIGCEITKSNEKEKGRTCDLIMDISKDLKIIVEMNQYRTDNIFKKNSDYALKLLTKNNRKNNKYGKIILINIDNFNDFDTNEPIVDVDIQSKNYVIENECYKSIHIILENMVNKEYNKDVNKEVIKFFEFLKMKSIEEMKEKYEGDEDYMKMVKKVEDYYNDPIYSDLFYDPEEKRKELLKDMKATGVRIGKELGLKLGEERGFKLGKEDGIKIGEERGFKLGEERGIEIGEANGRAAATQEFIQILSSMGFSDEEIIQIINKNTLKNKKLKKVKV